jgi:pectate lyase
MPKASLVTPIFRRPLTFALRTVGSFGFRWLVAGTFLLISVLSGRSTLYFTDQFSYTDGADLGATSGGGGATWSVASGDVTQIKVSAAATQTPPGGYAAAAGNGVAVTPTTSRKQTGVPFNGATGIPVADGNVVYASFLLNVQTLPGTGNMRVAYMHNVAASQGGIEVVVSSTGQVGIQKKGSGTTFVTGTPVANPGTHLVVMRYTFQTGNDEVAVWVDPSSSNYGVDPAPTTGAFAATTGGGSDMSNPILDFFIESPPVAGPVFWIDEVRIATTWSETTPANNQGYPPSVSFSSSDVSAYVGQTANFSVVAGGSAPLNYQWYFNTNTVLGGATNSTLTLTNVQTTNSGAYFCIVTNSYGADTSDVAQLTVTVPVAPNILAQPQNQTVFPGASASFSVSASGSTPLNYQWYFNTNTAIAGANSATLTVNNVQATNTGTYSVTVNNLAGSTNSAFAVLALNNTPVGPSFVSQPASVVAIAGGSASFSASASGTVPIFYQWLKNNSPVPGATNTTLTLTNIQNSDAATYALVASNSVSTTTSSNATLTITVASTLPFSAFNLTGFGGNATGGGYILETDPAYRKVTNALDFANAVLAANKTAGAVKVIEITTNLDLGWNEIDPTIQTLASTPFRSHNPPQLHPRLLVTGVSLIDIKPKSSLTIFSANGATVRHATFNVKSCSNIIIRNLKFDEMWEWDEASSPPGAYDKNDWDFIDLGNGGSVSNVWVDHCTFTKTYDGILDTKAGCSAITISWCKYTGDDGATNLNSFVWQQITSLESNKTSYPFYNFLRTHGFSTTDIVTIIQGHDKTHLAGQNDLDPNNATLAMTFHHLWLNNVWDRCVPRLRAGNVHDYNIYADDTLALAAKNLRNTRAAAMSTSDQNTLNNSYSFNPPLNGAISTEGGALLVEKSAYIDCLTPLRNNQTAPTNPVYTGKILALDSIYQMNSTSFRGNSTDPGGTNTFGPVQAAVIPFSWNTNFSTPNGVLPYSYTLDDPAQLQNIVAAGAGAGIVNWNKTNWLLTAYAPTAPVITAQPQNQSVAPGNSTTFTVVVSGSANLFYQWYFNTNTLLGGATNAALTLNNVQATNTGTYSVIITNSAGSVASTNAILSLSSGTHAKPQLASISFSNGSFSISVAGDSGVDYIVQASTNLMNWDSIFTNHSPVPPFTWSDTNANNWGHRYYRVLLSQ